MADIDITISIAEADIADFKEGFLKAKPKGDFTGTDLEYFNQFIEDCLFNVYKTGKMQIAHETTAAEINENIIDVR